MLFALDEKTQTSGQYFQNAQAYVQLMGKYLDEVKVEADIRV